MAKKNSQILKASQEFMSAISERMTEPQKALKPIPFWRTSGKYGFMSNFSIYPIFAESYYSPRNVFMFATTEHYYQAMKSSDQFSFDLIRSAPTPKQAKAIASRCILRENWEDIKFFVMLDALRYKIQQHPELQTKLRDTGIRYIYEDSPYDHIWGVGKDGTGENLLGKAWMMIRDELVINKFDI